MKYRTLLSKTKLRTVLLLVAALSIGCDPCLGTLCNDDENMPLETLLADGGCYDEDGCANGLWYCSIEIGSDADMAQLDGCQTVGGRLTISGDGVESLSGLGNIETVRGILAVQSTKLESLEGLCSLNTVGGLYLMNNPNLTDLGEMGHVIINQSQSSEEMSSDLCGWNLHSPGLVWLESNPELVQLDDLVNLGQMSALVLIDNDGLVELLDLGSFESSFICSLRLEGNDGLLSLSALKDVEQINNLVLVGNDSLISLSGLSGLRQVGFDVVANQLEISDNQALQDIESLMGITEMNARLVVENNPLLPSCDVKDVVDALEQNTEWTAEGNVSEEGNLADECSDLI